MLLWIFGSVKQNVVENHTATTASGKLEMEKATVSWTLSIDPQMLPAGILQEKKRTFRMLEIDNEVFEFNDGFTELHTQSYKEVLNGNGFPLYETKKAIELVHDIRNYRM